MLEGAVRRAGLHLREDPEIPILNRVAHFPGHGNNVVQYGRVRLFGGVYVPRLDVGVQPGIAGNDSLGFGSLPSQVSVELKLQATPVRHVGPRYLAPGLVVHDNDEAVALVQPVDCGCNAHGRIQVKRRRDLLLRAHNAGHTHRLAEPGLPLQHQLYLPQGGLRIQPPQGRPPEAILLRRVVPNLRSVGPEPLDHLRQRIRGQGAPIRDKRLKGVLHDFVDYVAPHSGIRSLHLLIHFPQAQGVVAKKLEGTGTIGLKAASAPHSASSS